MSLTDVLPCKYGEKSSKNMKAVEKVKILVKKSFKN